MELNYTNSDSAAVSSGCEILKNEMMSRHTTFKVGGPADRLYTVNTVSQLNELMFSLESENIPVTVLGNGSNILVSDKGIRGAVVTFGGDFKKIEYKENGIIRAGCAAMLSSLCAFARERSLSGLEFAWGIPGCIGGAVYMNAGAYGGEMKDAVTNVTARAPGGRIYSAKEDELGFSYRRSRYTGTSDIILSAEYALSPGNRVEIENKMNELMNRRKEKQPYDMPSAGSVFKRPEGAYAAALIEESGLKGRAVGDARVSEKHAGFIVNTGKATCSEICELIEIVKAAVKERTGYSLECEVRVTGEF